MVCVNDLHLSNVLLQPCDSVLEAGRLAAHAILHLSHLAQQRFILQIHEVRIKKGWPVSLV